MRRTFAGLLITGITYAVAATAPAVAQVPSSPAYPQSVYVNARADAYQAPSGGTGALGPLNALVGATNVGTCGVLLDATNGRETALCGL
jgi:hypothetical protein